MIFTCTVLCIPLLYLFVEHYSVTGTRESKHSSKENLLQRSIVQNGELIESASCVIHRYISVHNDIGYRYIMCYLVALCVLSITFIKFYLYRAA